MIEAYFDGYIKIFCRTTWEEQIYIFNKNLMIIIFL